MTELQENINRLMDRYSMVIIARHFRAGYNHSRKDGRAAFAAKVKKMAGKYDHLIVRSLKYEPPMSADFKEIYQKFAKRVLWIDDAVVPGAFQMNISWYNKVPELDPIFSEHAHHSAEIIGFFGSDPNDPYNLHGEIEIIIDGETHTIDSSSLIFIPPDLPHAMRILRVDQPIFHFSVVTEGQYNGAAYQ